MTKPAKYKIDPTEIVVFCIYVLLWFIAAFMVIYRHELGIDYENEAAGAPFFLSIISIFYLIYLAAHSFWREGNQKFYRWLLGFALLPFIIIIVIISIAKS